MEKINAAFDYLYTLSPSLTIVFILIIIFFILFRVVGAFATRGMERLNNCIFSVFFLFVLFLIFILLR